MNASGSPEGTFDYVIVGAGSAGCALAARLTEDPRVTVLLLEAGPRGGGAMVNVPAGTFGLMTNPSADWCFAVEPDATRRGAEQIWSAGRMLGGSSAINGMVYVRGLKGDFDGWAEDGCPGWSFADVWPYFLKSERFEGPPSQMHGSHGPLAVSPPRTVHPLAYAFLEACAESGMPLRDDYCGGDQFGAFLIWSTIARGVRSSAYRAFVAPVLKRANLTVLTDAQAEAIAFEGSRATGVCVRRGDRQLTYKAHKEVLVRAGAIGSPMLLLRSGIGPEADLKPLGVKVRADLPVGQNLHDHASLMISKQINRPSYNSPLGPFQIARHMFDYLLFKRGPLASAAVHAMAYGKTRPELAEPDIAFSLMPLALDFKATPPKLLDRPGVTIAGQICRPFARGRVRLRDNLPQSRPRIDYEMLADKRDLATLIAVGRKCEEIFAAPAMSRYVVGTNQPPHHLADDGEWADYVSGATGHGYHLAGSCRMGQAGTSVVAPSLEVHGFAGLRVVDASVMPRVTSGNTNAPTIMIAERAVDFIRQGGEASA